jgi:hypothetical protein
VTTKALGGIIAAVLGVVFACALCSAVVMGGVVAACTATTSPGTLPVATVPSRGWAAVDGFDAEQVGNAAAIVSVGAQLGVPVRGWVIAVATAIQESGLRNLPSGDRDSIGLSISLTQSAQAVQLSATPDAYARQEPAATTLVTFVGSGSIRAMSVDLEQSSSNCSPILSNDGVMPSPEPTSTLATGPA